MRIHHAFSYSFLFFLPLLFYGAVSFNDLAQVIGNFKYWTLFLVVFISNISIYLLNDFYDRHDDYYSKRKRERNVFCTKGEFLKGKGCLIISTLVPFLLSIISPFHFITALSLLVFSIFYSSPLFRVKSMPVCDILIHAIWFLSLFVPGYLFLLPMDIIFYLSCIVIVLYSTIVELGQEIADFNIDKQTGIKTTVTKLGFGRSIIVRNSIFIIFITMTLSTIVFVFMGLVIN